MRARLNFRINLHIEHRFLGIFGNLDFRRGDFVGQSEQLHFCFAVEWLLLVEFANQLCGFARSRNDRLDLAQEIRIADFQRRQLRRCPNRSAFNGRGSKDRNFPFVRLRLSRRVQMVIRGGLSFGNRYVGQ